MLILNSFTKNVDKVYDETIGESAIDDLTHCYNTLEECEDSCGKCEL